MQYYNYMNKDRVLVNEETENIKDKMLSETEIKDELGNMIFQDPSKINEFNDGYVIASEYLSGNVKAKLNIAELDNKDGIYDKNIEALKLGYEYDLLNI